MSDPWDLNALTDLPGSPLFRGDERIASLSGDVVMAGNPHAVIRSRDSQDIADALNYCDRHRIPVTFSGGRSGLTGAAACEEGVLIATAPRNKILDVGNHADGRAYAICEPGVFLGELKEAVRAKGYFYPPDPTSFREACLGGTVATNATGEDSLLYGSTRKYIRALKIIQADGQPRELIRPPEDHPPETKGTAGYSRPEPLIDLMIGSEGTLAYFDTITVDLLPAPPDHWAAIGFFPGVETALAFVLGALNSPDLNPRALEFLDHGSMEILREDPEVPAIPAKARAAIYWKQEFQEESHRERTQGDWLSLLEEILKPTPAPDLANDIWVAETAKDHEKFRRWRHKIPATINERFARYHPEGGRKVATDWWVPPAHIQPALAAAWQDSQAAGLEAITFGHIGNGHPHINYIAKNSQEVIQARKILRRQCERAVTWGGGVAGEHGIGKIFRDLLAVQHPTAVIEQMKALKRQWDPHWILGRNTLFPFSA